MNQGFVKYVIADFSKGLHQNFPLPAILPALFGSPAGRYEDTKGDKRSLKVTGNSAIQYSAYEFLLVFHAKYVFILHRF